MGTLTGAARVALGPDLPPFYTDDETLAADVARCAQERERSAVAHAAVDALTTAGSIPRSPTSTTSPSGGIRRLDHLRAVPQALRRARKSWLHVDIYAWTPSAKPGRPEGGECQAARAIYKLLSERYA